MSDTNETGSVILDPGTGSQIREDIREIEWIAGSGILGAGNDHPFRKALLIQTLINLRDLMAKCVKFATRVDFKDDVIQSQPGDRRKVHDVTDLITFFRDALCHPEADHPMLTPNIRLVLGTVRGKKDFTMFEIGGGSLDPPCDYEDDIAFIFGLQRIYLKRHILRAFDEAKQLLISIRVDTY